MKGSVVCLDVKRKYEKGSDSVKLKPIYVTRPFLPTLEELSEGLKEIWANRWLINNGPIVTRFAGQLFPKLSDLAFGQTG